MKELSYISDDRILELAREVLKTVKLSESRVEKNLAKNVLDPFSAIFDAARSGKTVDEWFQAEKDRQVQKSLQNAIGTFHQRVLGSMPGWVDTKRGGSVDLRSDDRKIIAEVKNKYNTMNSSSAEAVFKKFENHLRYVDKGYVAYLVSVVPRTPQRYDREWTHSAKLSTTRPDIREVDGASFYALVTGDKDALANIYQKLLVALASLTEDDKGILMSDLKTTVLFEKAYGR